MGRVEGFDFRKAGDFALGEFFTDLCTQLETVVQRGIDTCVIPGGIDRGERDKESFADAELVFPASRTLRQSGRRTPGEERERKQIEQPSVGTFQRTSLPLCPKFT